MIIRPQIIKMTWNNRTKDYYISKGYNYTSTGDIFDCDIEDLPLGSNKEVLISCDVCGNKKYRSYAQSLKDSNHYCSKNCRKNKINYEKEFLIKEFYRYKKENGKYPNCEDMQTNKGFPSYYNYLKIWSSWSVFLDELEIYEEKSQWLKSDIEILKNIYSNTSKEVIINSLENCFSWGHICQKAQSLGLKRKYKSESKKAYSKEFLINEFWRFFKEFNRYPLLKELNKTNGYPTSTGYIRIWESWDSFLKGIGVIRSDCEDGWYIFDENILYENYPLGEKEVIMDKLMIKRNWNTIKKKASSLGIKRNKLIRQKLSDEFLIDELKRYYNEYNKVPTYNEFEQDINFPSAAVYKKRFGTWNNGLIKSGLKLNLIMKHSKELFINEAVSFFNENARSPLYNELVFSHSVIKNYWENWGEFLIESGLKPNIITHDLKTKQDGIKLLNEIYKNHNFVPTVDFVYKNYGVNQSWFIRKFGSFTKALFESGLIHENKILDKNEWINKSIEGLNILYEDLQRVPTVVEYDNFAKINFLISRRNLEDALGYTYVEICLEQFGDANKISKTKEQLFGDLEELKNKLGRSPYVKELKEYGLASANQYRSVFGMKYADIIESLGWELNQPKMIIKTDDELLNDYFTLYKKLNRLPLNEDIDNESDMASSGTYKHRFGDYTNIWSKLNIDVSEELKGDHRFGIGFSCLDNNGEVCRSYQEMIITNFFIDNDIEYIKEYPYNKLLNNPKDRRRFDWYLPSKRVAVEYFGMFKETSENEIFKKYSNKVKRKLKDCKNVDLLLIDLYKEDMENKFEGFLEKINKFVI